jgi:hypothetical protein
MNQFPPILILFFKKKEPVLINSDSVFGESDSIVATIDSILVNSASKPS